MVGDTKSVRNQHLYDTDPKATTGDDDYGISIELEYTDILTYQIIRKIMFNKGRGNNKKSRDDNRAKPSEK
jgi:hypothetical protein